MIKKQIIDQSMHLLWGFAAGAIVALCGGPLWACVLATLIIEVPREFVDQWPINSWADTLADMAVFALGGTLASLVFSTTSLA